MKLTIIISGFLLTINSVVAQTKELVKINGFAPEYVGKSVDIFQIEDYLSMKESKLGSGTVQADSTFSITFFADKTQKVRVRSNNNESLMYIQPSSTYHVFLPEKDKYSPYRPAGNAVELTFYGLDSTDINYKILQFNRWSDNFMATEFKGIRLNPAVYNQKMDSFKMIAQNYYIADTGKYIYDYVKFSIASLDNVPQVANRNRYEKYDFYLRNYPVKYENDAYMEYFTSFYNKLIPRLSMEANNRVYLGVLKGSPTLVMRALGLEYTLENNRRIRELVMIQALSEMYFSDDFPQTNIITILDSVANHAMFEANKPIARNMIERLTDVVPGGKAPNFALTNTTGELKSLNDFKKKHLYIHFFDPSSSKNKIEIPLLVSLYGTYNNDIQFITVCPKSKWNEQSKEVLDDIPWQTVVVEDSNPVFKNYKIETYPNYVFIDPYSYVIAAPALGPQPNGNYETIDKSFFGVQKINKQMRGEN